MNCSLFSVIGDEDDRSFSASDFERGIARWCPGCGDHAVLTAMQKLLAAESLTPERTVFVSGIGCSSRFPHYMKTYGFHTLHGRALPVATGVKLSRPELTVFTVMGDGDCTSIGAGHWVHAMRYNVDMTAIMLDNEVYGLTKNQTSPTTPAGFKTNTQPRGSILPPLNPLQVMLGISNVSFVAQTVEWNPKHLYETLTAAYKHKGLAFVRVLQRCPQYTSSIFTELVRNPKLIEEVDHDRTDINAARKLAAATDKLRIGIYYQNSSAPTYEEIRRVPKYTAEEKVELLNKELDRYAV